MQGLVLCDMIKNELTKLMRSFSCIMVLTVGWVIFNIIKYFTNHTTQVNFQEHHVSSINAVQS